MEDFLTRIQAVWPLVMEAPWAFVAIALALLLAGWLVGRFAFNERIATLQGRIEGKDDEIGRLNARLIETATPSRLAEDIILLSDASSTGNPVQIAAGIYNWSIDGEWDGSYAQLEQRRNRDAPWVELDGMNIQDNGGWTNIALSNGQIRVVIANPGKATRLYSSLSRIS